MPPAVVLRSDLSRSVALQGREVSFEGAAPTASLTRWHCADLESHSVALRRPPPAHQQSYANFKSHTGDP
jgi:hypothetical protein